MEGSVVMLIKFFQRYVVFISSLFGLPWVDFGFISPSFGLPWLDFVFISSLFGLPWLDFVFISSFFSVLWLDFLSISSLFGLPRLNFVFISSSFSPWLALVSFHLYLVSIWPLASFRLHFVFVWSSLAKLLQNQNPRHASSDLSRCDSMFPLLAAYQNHKITAKYRESVQKHFFG